MSKTKQKPLRLNQLPRCAFVNENNKRCRKHSAIKHRVYLDESIYGINHCVEINLCVEHALLLGKDFLKE